VLDGDGGLAFEWYSDDSLQSISFYADGQAVVVTGDCARVFMGSMRLTDVADRRRVIQKNLLGVIRKFSAETAQWDAIEIPWKDQPALKLEELMKTAFGYTP
ncbi:hypothetical protein LCGC14_2702070, partial [marine sediment metagenome]